MENNQKLEKDYKTIVLLLERRLDQEREMNNAQHGGLYDEGFMGGLKFALKIIKDQLGDI